MPRSGGNTLQGLERLLRPTQERVSLAVALELELGVAGERVGRAGEVGDDRVVDHEVDGDPGLDLGGVAAEPRDRIAERGEIGDRGHAGEVLHEDACGHELQLAVSGFLLGTTPIRDGAYVVGGDVDAVFPAQEVLDQDAQRVGQSTRIADDRVEPEDVVRAVADGQT